MTGVDWIIYVVGFVVTLLTWVFGLFMSILLVGGWIKNSIAWALKKWKVNEEKDKEGRSTEGKGGPGNKGLATGKENLEVSATKVPKDGVLGTRGSDGLRRLGNRRIPS